MKEEIKTAKPMDICKHICSDRKKALYAIQLTEHNLLTNDDQNT